MQVTFSILTQTFAEETYQASVRKSRARIRRRSAFATVLTEMGQHRLGTCMLQQFLHCGVVQISDGRGSCSVAITSSSHQNLTLSGCLSPSAHCPSVCPLTRASHHNRKNAAPCCLIVRVDSTCSCSTRAAARRHRCLCVRPPASSRP